MAAFRLSKRAKPQILKPPLIVQIYLLTSQNFTSLKEEEKNQLGLQLGTVVFRSSSKKWMPEESGASR